MGVPIPARGKHRTLWIVVGIAGAIFVFFVVILTLAGLKFANTLAGAGDPVKARTVAAKIANFKVPPGYRIAAALDFSFARFAMLAAEHGQSPSALMVEGLSAPGVSDEQLVEQMRASGNSIPCRGVVQGTVAYQTQVNGKAYTLRRAPTAPSTGCSCARK